MTIYSYLSDRREIKEDVKYVETYTDLQKVGTALTSWMEVTAHYLIILIRSTIPMISGDFLTPWNATGNAITVGKGRGSEGKKDNFWNSWAISYLLLYVNLLPYGNMIFSILFVLFYVQNLCCNYCEYHSLNWKDVSVKNIDVFEKKQFSLHFFFSLFRLTQSGAPNEKFWEKVLKRTTKHE